MSDIRSADTIFVYFDARKKFENLHFKILDSEIAQTYVYQFPDGKALRFRNYKKEQQPLLKNKSVIAKEHLRVLSTELMQQSGFFKVLQSVYNPKRPIYLIVPDKSKKNILLKRVFMENSPEIVD